VTTKPWVQAAGVRVLNQPFYADGNVATAGGCLASQYLAGWIIARAQGVAAATEALHYVAPVGEKEEYVSRGLRNITPYLPHADLQNPSTAGCAVSNTQPESAVI
jgi:hypothetical protein